ncbi:MAG: hypothetical protein U1A77_12700 [Pirellulales bacterium]
MRLFSLASPRLDRRGWIGVWMVVCAMCFVGVCRADSPATEASFERTKALEWLDQYAVRQALFHPEDIEKLRTRVAAMSPMEAKKWWEESASRRELLDNPEWRETEKWLREFLRVQAIYSDDQIRELQAKAFQKSEMSARSLREVMDDITRKRRELAQGARQSDEIRKEMIAARDAFREDNAREKEAARRRTAASYPASPTPNVGGRELRGRYNQPLVTSLDAARWSIVGGFFPRW